MTSTTDTIETKCCVDCLMLIANGDTTGNPRCEAEEGEAEYVAEVDRNLNGYHAVPTSWPGDWTEDDRYYGRDTEARFTMNECPICRDGLGGDRFPLVLFAN